MGLLVLAALAAIAGCGGGSDRDELVSRLPEDSLGFVYTDLAALREEFDLPEDAAPDIDSAPDLAQAANTIGGALPGQKFEALRALELGQADAIVIAVGGEQVTAISSDADAEEVGSALVDLGWEQDEEGVFTTDEAAIAFGDGLIGIAEDPSAASAVLAEPEGEFPAEIEDIEGAVVSFFTTPDSTSCLRGEATSDTPGSPGEIILFPSGDPDAASVEAPEEGQFSEPRVDGNSVRIEVTPEKDAPAYVLPAREAQISLQVTYDCEDGGP